MKKEGYVVDARRARGQPDPEWYRDCPEIRSGDEMYFMAIWHLDGERHLGSGGVGRIPWSRVMEYAEKRIGLRCPRVVIMFCDIVFEMDTGYLQWMTGQHAAAVKSQNAKFDHAEKARARVASKGLTA